MNVLIPGITGQDGFYLTQKLLAKNHTLVGLTRNLESDHSKVFLNHFPNVNLIEFDPRNIDEYEALFKKHSFDSIVNLAGPSSVKLSFENPIGTISSMLEPVKSFCEVAILHQEKILHFIQASSSEVYGGIQSREVHENSVPLPVNPYGQAKYEVSLLLKKYSDTGAIKFTNVIMFNHESPVRGEAFVAQKIVTGLVRIKYGTFEKISLGNVDLERDWSYAGDFMDAIVTMIAEVKTGTYVLASGNLHAIWEIAQIAHKYLSISQDLNDVFEFDKTELRQSEPNSIFGNNSKARADLRWSPKIDFVTLVKLMVDSEVAKFHAQH
jgi:GDPmannose 4,6-dehydratase